MNEPNYYSTVIGPHRLAIELFLFRVHSCGSGDGGGEGYSGAGMGLLAPPWLPAPVLCDAPLSARHLCTLLLLVTRWCHGVTLKWVPSHVAARGSATSETMNGREGSLWRGGGVRCPNPSPPLP